MCMFTKSWSTKNQWETRNHRQLSDKQIRVMVSTCFMFDPKLSCIVKWKLSPKKDSKMKQSTTKDFNKLKHAQTEQCYVLPVLYQAPTHAASIHFSEEPAVLLSAGWSWTSLNSPSCFPVSMSKWMGK